MATSSRTSGAFLWNPQSQMASVLDDRLTIVSGHGSTIETDDGRSLIDATASLWYANIGHGRERLADAAAAQMKKLEAYHTFGRIANDQALLLADRVAGMSPIDDPRIFFVSGGSDAIETAGKLARRFWQVKGQASKKILISRTQSYHGLHGFGTSILGLDIMREGYGSESLIPETARVPATDAEALEDEILRLGPDRVAAVFAEPIIGTGGVILPPEGYLQRVEEICRTHDVLFIADEVITGFGRTGTMFATTHYEISPDMVIMAKGITSGYVPLGGVIAGPRVWEPFYEADGPWFRHGLTYSGHSTACAVAQANLDLLEEEELVARVASMSPVLYEKLSTLASHDRVVEVRGGTGFIAGVQMDPDVDGDALQRACIDDGVLIRILGGNVVQISPPFVIEESEIDRIAEALGSALDAAA